MSRSTSVAAISTDFHYCMMENNLKAEQRKKQEDYASAMGKMLRLIKSSVPFTSPNFHFLFRSVRNLHMDEWNIFP